MLDHNPPFNYALFTYSPFLAMATTGLPRSQAELATELGLSERYIRHCLDKLKELLVPLLRRGPNGKWLFPEEAVEVFRQIKQWRDNGLQMRDIRVHLAVAMAGTSPVANPDSALVNSPANHGTLPRQSVESVDQLATERHLQYLERELEAYKAKEQELLAKLATANQELVAKLEDWQKQHLELHTQLLAKDRLVYELDRGIQRLTGGLDMGVYKQHIDARQTQREHAIAELQRIEGKWFHKKRRRELLRLLEENR